MHKCIIDIYILLCFCLSSELVTCSTYARHANDLTGAHRMHFAPKTPVKEMSQRCTIHA
jgi:hypothetical protein